ncbi:hypothetical protein Ciccas_012245 [Cichlidogyrus casuarinus]|uniref:Uncharacterized protein n=1 Tax=Cichlidogyrus casuarinus TaxID=1844966 RepID=A0ABD2PP07_9PLAT
MLGVESENESEPSEVVRATLWTVSKKTENADLDTNTRNTSLSEREVDEESIVTDTEVEERTESISKIADFPYDENMPYRYGRMEQEISTTQQRTQDTDDRSLEVEDLSLLTIDKIEPPIFMSSNVKVTDLQPNSDKTLSLILKPAFSRNSQPSSHRKKCLKALESFLLYEESITYSNE